MPELDLTPDPRVLVALTHTPLQPLDALCELIDNAIDSFESARIAGHAVDHPLIEVQIPGAADIDSGRGSVVVRDNGLGMTVDQAEKALRAGYSSHNPYDSLGLFGMGFNIASGKLGRCTRFLTARPGSGPAVEVTVDLLQMQEQGSYRVPVLETERPEGLRHGTVVEVSGWWPEGNPNYSFIRKVATLPKKTLREQLGRRYSTILRGRGVRIMANGEPCDAFEHCVWDDTRFVTHPKHGHVPAVYRFDKVVGQQVRCTECNGLTLAGEECPGCGSRSLRTIEERIRGWVGIQRFDHSDTFGVDLIRNGRAVRVSEKAAFFEYRDEFSQVIRDYPIDSPYGRIVGEVHLDHVPVDFLKQDFQRTTPEWQNAMVFLRGSTSLQPQQVGSQENHSPLFLLYQGYRRVRNFGKRDMYMGYWDRDADKPKRISREIERDYYEKFLQRMPGFYDDAEWWMLVEAADKKPLEDYVDCPECGAQNLKESERCTACGTVLRGKKCINPECGSEILASDLVCEFCGSEQVARPREPWTCEVCAKQNEPETEACSLCGSARGSKGLATRERLREFSDLDDDLSWLGCSVPLPDGTHTAPLDIRTHVTQLPIQAGWEGPFVPAVVFKSNDIEIFVDKTHPVFRALQVRPEWVVCAEAAQYIYDTTRHLLSAHRSSHSLSNLTSNMLQMRWGDMLEDSPERLKADISAFLDTVRIRVQHAAGDVAPRIFEALTDRQKEALVKNMLGAGEDVASLGRLRDSGEYLRYIDDSTVVDLFRRHPVMFFDGKLWSEPYADFEGLSGAVAEEARSLIASKYLNCLEDAVAYIRYSTPEPLLTSRARASLGFLKQRLS